MPAYLWILLIIIILQRLMELKQAKANEQWMKARGGVEFGEKHYKWFIVIHTLFFASITLEVLFRGTSGLKLNYVLLIAFVVTQIVRIWCIHSLGRFWNTKIIISPDFSLVSEGPYKYIKHPNYVIVGIELFVIPLLFGAYITSIIFPVLHILLLMVRIPCEEKALKETL